MGSEGSDYNEIEDTLRENSRKRRLNDKSLTRASDDLEGSFVDLTDWIHDDVVILDELLASVSDFCADDASKILIEDYRKDIQRIDSKRQSIWTGSGIGSPLDDLSIVPDNMTRLSEKINELIPLISELHKIRRKLNEIKKVKRLQTDEEYDDWVRAGEDESLS